MKYGVVLLLLCLLAWRLSAQSLPMPNQVTYQVGQLDLDKGWQWKGASDNLQQVWQPVFQQVFKMRQGSVNVTFKLQGQPKVQFAGVPDAAYHLSVNARGISIVAATEAGQMAALQHLLTGIKQDSIGKCFLQYQDVQDIPRFAWRGVHLDVSRHFFPVSFIKQYIDLLALNKLNVFHWHLTDDQGWRIEIKQYPKLISVGSKRKESRKWYGGSLLDDYDGVPHEGYYTQEQIREIVAYAAKRHILVVPEIDMPGHMQAAIAAYPELGCTGKPVEVWTNWGVSHHILDPKPYTMQFMRNVLDEVVSLFPSPYIHIGGDEAEKEQWKNSQSIQSQIKTLGLKDEAALQSWFIKEMERHLNSKGRQLIGWDEILEGGLAPNAAVMSWRGTKGGIEAAKQQHNVVMTPTRFMYFDFYQSERKWEEPLAIGGMTNLERVYSFDPAPDSLGTAVLPFIQGAQGNLWTEYVASPKHAFWMLIPRIFALSEICWTLPSRKQAYPLFLDRAKNWQNRLDLLGFKGRPLDYPAEAKTGK